MALATTTTTTIAYLNDAIGFESDRTGCEPERERELNVAQVNW